MNFLADEDVEKPVVEMLRHGGHDVLYMCEITTRTLDEKLLEQANSESRILLTMIKIMVSWYTCKGKFRLASS